MADVQFVSARGLEQARRRAARLAGDRPEHEGWSVDADSGALLVRAFSRLHLDPELRLVTFAHRSSGGANGWTFAVPAGAPTPRVEEVAVPGRFEPRPPAGARGHFMEAIIGDGSLRSHVQASVLWREIAELGAAWHGLEWSTHMLVGASPGDEPAIFGRSLYTTRTRDGVVIDESWTWLEEPQSDWRPRAEGIPEGIAVTLWSYSELGRAHIDEHRDLYCRSHGLAPISVTRRTLGQGTRGFVF